MFIFDNLYMIRPNMLGPYFGPNLLRISNKTTSTDANNLVGSQSRQGGYRS
jgi:hypothetical protein